MRFASHIIPAQRVEIVALVMRPARILFPAILWLTCLFAAAPILADEETIYPLEPAHTSSPRATLKSYREAWKELYDDILSGNEYGEEDREMQEAANRIRHCLDMSELPPSLQQSMGDLSAVCLQKVLDRIDLPPESEIPSKEEIAAMAAEG